MPKEDYWLSKQALSNLSDESITTIKSALSEAQQKGDTILFTSSPATADVNISTFICMLGIAQYNSDWIISLAERKIDLEFEDAEGSIIPMEQWLMNAELQNWFSLLREHCPCAMLFLRQWECVFLVASSDIVASLSHDEIEWKDGAGATFHFSEMENHTVQERVIQQCVQFINYCAGTGVEPRKYVEELLQRFGYVLPYEKIYELWEINRTAQ